MVDFYASQNNRLGTSYLSISDAERVLVYFGSGRRGILKALCSVWSGYYLLIPICVLFLTLLI